MVEKVFYVETGDEIKPIKLSDINMLAMKALSLVPESEMTEAIGYEAALDTYYQTEDDDLKECHRVMNSSKFGKIFLCSAINLSLLENSFRDNGISEQDINVYNKVIADYQRQLNFNRQQYGEKEEIERTK